MSAVPAVAVFDAYGTLFDVHSAVARLTDAIGPEASRISAIWRQKQLEYSWTYALMQRYVDFWQLTQDALDFALASVGQGDPRARAQLLDAYRTLDAYPDVPAVLDDYRRAGLRVAVFSNATPAMLEHALDAAQLRDRVDVVFSVHPLARYKPDPRVYDAAAEALGVVAMRLRSTPPMPGTPPVPPPAAGLCAGSTATACPPNTRRSPCRPCATCPKPGRPFSAAILLASRPCPEPTPSGARSQKPSSRAGLCPVAIATGLADAQLLGVGETTACLGVVDRPGLAPDAEQRWRHRGCRKGG